MEDYTSPLKTEYSAKYDDNPRKDLIKVITGSPEIIFEIGCGSGATGAVLKQKFKNLQYFGLEFVEEAAYVAQTRLDKVIIGNIEKINLDDYGLPKGNIDIIICADVLEHLYDPWKTLFILKDYLKPNGKIVASIPNIQNIDIILKLLSGNWTYTKYGLLDATHIRFFTLNEIAKLFTNTGYKISDTIPILNKQIEGNKWPKDLEFEKITLKQITELEAIKLCTFQYIIVAQKI